MIEAQGSGSLFGRLGDALQFRRMTRADKATIDAVGALCEAFRRAPADLGDPAAPGTVDLYPEQITTALALLQQCIVQMDTGEGKTYAILPAAACLARRHGKVFIVCANEYLAERDATRTLSFWNFIGFRVGLFVDGSPEDELDCDVIYTTLAPLVFHVMNEDTAWVRSPNVAGFGALIIDEADSVLIDNAFQEFNVVRFVQAQAFDWTLAIKLASELTQVEHIIEDHGQMTATLTVEGETFLRNALRSSGIAMDRLLEMRHAIELAYVATRMAHEDTHYIEEDGKVVYVDPKSGDRRPFVQPSWFVPLMAVRGHSSAMRVNTDQSWAISILTRFEHLCGLSGTIRDNTIEYVISFKLFPVEVPPRKPRRGDVFPDNVFRTQKEALDHAMTRISEELAKGRPVLVGTQNVSDAERLYESAVATIGPDVTKNLLTAKNDSEAADFFKRAGASKTLTIGTQIAGRGVDIRLTEEARAAGGMALVGIGRNKTARHDRQFLGRAGRQGDPFTAEFIMSLEDELFRIHGWANLDEMLVKLGLKPGEAIQHPWIDKAVRTAQNNILYRDWQTRWHSLFASEIHSESRNRILRWFSLLQLDEQDQVSTTFPPDAFVRALIDHFLEVNLSPYRHRGAITAAMSEEICQRLEESLSGHPLPIRALQIEGMQMGAAIDFLKDLLGDHLTKMFVDYEQAHVNIEFQAGQLIEKLEENHASSVLPPEMPQIDEASEQPADDYVDKALSPANSGPPPFEFEDFAQRVHLFQYASYLMKNRTPLATARASLNKEWTSYLDEAARKASVLSHKGLGQLDYYRRLREETNNLLERTEGQFSANSFHFLLHCDTPWQLDGLYLLEDQTVASRTAPANRERLSGGSAAALASGSQHDGSTAPITVDSAYIATFLSINDYDSRDRRAAEHLIVEFLREFPITTLRTPQKIAAAVQSWQSQQYNYTKARQSWRAKVLQRFLRHLHSRRLVGELPSFQHLAGAFWQRAIANLKQLRVSVIVAAMLCGTVALLGLSLIPINEPVTFGSDSLRALNLLGFGGLLSDGKLVAPVIGGIVLASALMNSIVSMNTSEDHLRNYAGYYLGLLLTVVLAATLALRGQYLFSFRAIVLATMCVLVNAALFNIMRLAAMVAASQTGVSLLSALFAATATALILDVTKSDSATHTLWFLAVCAVLIGIVELRNSRLKFSLNARTRRTTDVSTMQGDSLPVDVTVAPTRIATAYLVAAACYLLVNEILERYFNFGLATVTWVGVAAYIMVAVAIMYRSAVGRTSPRFWRTYLVDNRTEIDEEKSLEQLLAIGRWRLLSFDIGLLVLGLLTLFIAEMTFRPETRQWTHPVGPVLLAGIVLWADSAIVFISQFVRFVLNRGASPMERFEAIVGGGDKKGFIATLHGLLQSQLVAVITLVILILKSVDILIDSWKVVEKYIFFWL